MTHRILGRGSPRLRLPVRNGRSRLLTVLQYAAAVLRGDWALGMRVEFGGVAAGPTARRRDDISGGMFQSLGQKARQSCGSRGGGAGFGRRWKSSSRGS